MGAGLLTVPVQGQPPRGALYTVELPGGLPAALDALGDRTSPDRARFLVEVIRRFNSRRPGGQAAVLDPALQALLRQLKTAAAQSQPAADLLPLPLPAALWQGAVFGGRELPHGLVVAILEARNASLLYSALLTTDDETRTWLAGQPELVSELARLAPAFVLAAPAVRVTGGAVRVPGGAQLEPMWEALVGEPPRRAAPFIRALLEAREGRLAYFYGAVGQLAEPRLRLAFNLDAADPAAHRAAGRQLLDVFDRLASGWRIVDWPLSPPGLDPALLAAELPVNEAGQPALPGTERFWTRVFADEANTDDAPTAAQGKPVQFAWLANRVFQGDPERQRRRYLAALFASRRVGPLTAETAPDAMTAVRTVIHQPSLAAALDRSGSLDPQAIAAAARRGTALSSVNDDERATRALAQFQGALFVVTRAVARGALRREALPEVITALAAVAVNDRGDYEGAMVRALETVVRRHAPPPSTDPESGCAAGSGDRGTDLEDGLLRLTAGCTDKRRRTVDWEGTRYLVDSGAADARRLAHFLGEPRRPLIASAWQLVAAAERLEAPALTREQVDVVARAFDEIGTAIGWDGDRWLFDVPARAREARGRLGDGKARSVPEARRAAPVLRLLADDLLAHGLLELAYAAALGSPERALILADDVAARHEFGRHVTVGQREEWEIPAAGSGRERRWHARGSLLGLDVALASFSLVRLSSRPPSRPPSVSEELQKALAEAAVLASPAELTDEGADEMRAALDAGRAALAALADPGGASSVAGRAGLGPTDSSLLPWVVAHDPDRLGAFLSPGDLLALGLGGRVVPPLDAWGAPARLRHGCFCLRMPQGPRWEHLAGRSAAGMLASTFPDLNIRLAGLLHELDMPAELLAAVLGAATADLLDHAASRDVDDRRALVEFVQGLDTARVEEYLALLTSGGPLVPVGDSRSAAERKVQ
jgi:hypothetical protein